MQHIAALVLFAAMLVALPLGNANAQPATGWYLSQELGGNRTPVLEFEGNAPNAPGSICAANINPFADLMPPLCSDPNAPGTA